jgi:hypothetical protein
MRGGGNIILTNFTAYIGSGGTRAPVVEYFVSS